MGGEWGLGAALAMEKIPTERRGFFSGVLQEGYSVGYLLASVAFLLVTNVGGLSWRWLFGAVDHPGADHAWSSGPGCASPRCGRRRGSGSARPGRRRATSSPTRAIVAAVRLPGPAHDGVQLDEPRHPGHLPDVPEGGPATSRSATATWIVDRLQHRRDHRRHRLRHAVGALRPAPHRSCSARVLGLPIVPIFAYSTTVGMAGARLVPDAGRACRAPGASSRPTSPSCQPGRDPRLLPGRDLPARQLPGGLQPADPAGAGQVATATRSPWPRRSCRSSSRWRS